MPKFTCYIIGDDSLVIEAALYLLKNDAAIQAISSTNFAVETWTKRQGISFVPDLTNLTEEVDYIFSLSNMRKLSDELLARVRVYAINYHNAPLPSYRGVHSTTWAIIDRRREHGITFHVMKPKQDMDAGDIIYQEKVPIEEDDTTSSLNTRCHRLALEKFKTHIVDPLIQGQELLTYSQSEESVSVYTLQDKVVDDGLIHWDAYAIDIERLHRAMFIRDMINRLGLPKFLVKNEHDQLYAFVPVSLKLTGEKRFQTPAGTITKIVSGTGGADNDYIQVATKSDDIRIQSSVIDISTGEELTIPKFVARYGLKTAMLLYNPKEKDRQSLEAQSRKMSKHENYWIEEWEKIVVLSLPSAWKENSEHSSELHFSRTITAVFKESANAKNVLAIILIYLQQIHDAGSFTVGFSDPSLRKLCDEFQHLFFSNLVPFNLTIDLRKKTFQQAVDIVEELLKKLQKKQVHASDLFLRIPSIRQRQHVLPIMINILENGQASLSHDNCQISFDISADGKTLHLYLADKVSSKAQEMILNHIRQLLTEYEKDSNKIISEVSVLTPEERKTLQLLKGPVCDFSPVGFIDDLIEKRGSDRDIDAVQRGGEDVRTYHGLASNINRIANYLLQQNIQKGDRVVVCLDPTLISIEVMFAIMRVGAVYVPIDSAYPVEYVNNVVQDVNPTMIITRSGKGELFKINDLEIIYLDQVWQTNIQGQSKRSSKNLPKRNPEDLVYIIYTTGTTGKPKGVPITYKNFWSGMKAREAFYQGNSCFPRFPELKGSSVLLTLSPAFDASMAAICWPLMFGGKLVLQQPHNKGIAAKILSQIEKRQITILICVPALYRQILEAAKNNIEVLQSIRAVIIGGDIFDRTLLEMHQQCLKGAYLFNEYGTTETTICNASSLLYDPVRGINSRIGIGLPFANTEFAIFDSTGQPVPPGISGRLYIAGDSVMRGYWGREDLNAQCFLDVGGKRYYETGDIGHYVGANEHAPTIMFDGRKDRQVKVSGYLVRLDVIESCLLSHPNVKECAVVARSTEEERFLEAYIVLKQSGEEMNYDSLRDFLRGRLPLPFVPDNFYELDQLPLSRNMKIDRKVLMAGMNGRKQIERLRSDSDYEEGLSDSKQQRELAAIWRRILALDASVQIGATTSFFNLGGKSLLLNRMIMTVEEKFKTKIQLSEFLKSPTISTLERIIQNLEIKSTEEPAFIRDAKLPLMITLPEQPVRVNVKKAFLTGATGFLGGFVLQELCKNDVQVYCLIRARSVEEAKVKLLNNIRNLGLTSISEQDIAPEGKIRIILGDLEKENLGLTSDTLTELADEVDAIYAVGAAVNHLYDYKFLKRANVNSVRAMIQMATRGRHLKHIHYVSTLGVSTLLEDFPSPENPSSALTSGYSETKWTAERLLAQASEKGVPVSVYRPGWILGDSRFGKMPAFELNHLWSLILMCRLLKVIPNWQKQINLLPVDLVAKIIVGNSLSFGDNAGKVYNLYLSSYDKTWVDLVSEILSVMGCHFRVVTPEEWRKSLMNAPAFHTRPFLLFSIYSQEGAEVPGIEGEISNGNVTKVYEQLGLNVEYPGMVSSESQYLQRCALYAARQYLDLSMRSSVSPAGFYTKPSSPPDSHSSSRDNSPESESEQLDGMERSLRLVAQ